MIRIVALIERYHHCKGFVYMRDGQVFKVMNETFGELLRIIATPQPSTFFASSVCLAQTQKLAFQSEESSSLPSKMSHQNTPYVVNGLWCFTTETFRTSSVSLFLEVIPCSSNFCSSSIQSDPFLSGEGETIRQVLAWVREGFVGSVTITRSLSTFPLYILMGLCSLAPLWS